MPRELGTPSGVRRQRDKRSALRLRQVSRTLGFLPINKMNGWNYFNYFTEIEEYFWRKRGAHLLVSPLDWAIMEAWQKAGVPLEAVLKGIDRAFESYGRSRRGAGKPLKSLAYCTDAVLEAAEEQLEAGTGKAPASLRGEQKEPFPREELKAYFEKNVQKLKQAAENSRNEQPELAAGIAEITKSVEATAAILETPGTLDLEDLERRLSVLDEKTQALLTSRASEDLMLKIR